MKKNIIRIPCLLATFLSRFCSLEVRKANSGNPQKTQQLKLNNNSKQKIGTLFFNLFYFLNKKHRLTSLRVVGLRESQALRRDNDAHEVNELVHGK